MSFKKYLVQMSKLLSFICKLNIVLDKTNLWDVFFHIYSECIKKNIEMFCLPSTVSVLRCKRQETTSLSVRLTQIVSVQTTPRDVSEIVTAPEWLQTLMPPVSTQLVCQTTLNVPLPNVQVRYCSISIIALCIFLSEKLTGHHWD